MIYNTFSLVWCESCGKATNPPQIQELGLVDAAGPVVCSECGDMVTLLECIIHPATTMWQRARGAAWHHVLFLSALERLPTSGRLYRSLGGSP